MLISAMKSILFIYFVYLFLTVLGLRCCVRAFSSCGEQGLLLLQSTGCRCTGFSSCSTRALEYVGFSSYGVQAE